MMTITPATAEPVTVTELARNLRLFTGDGDYAGQDVAELQALITAARVDAENYSGRYFCQQTLRQHYPSFQRMLTLHIDVSSIAAVRYYDPTNTLQTLPATDYFLTLEKVMFFDQHGLSDVYDRADAVQIDFGAGMERIPQPVKQAILLIASHWHENREASSPLQVRDVPLSYQWLLDSYRIVRVG